MLLRILALAGTASAFWDPIGDFRPFGPGFTHGAYPQDFSVVGGPLEAVHDSQEAPTGLAVDSEHHIYLTYPRNMGPTPNNVVIATGYVLQGIGRQPDQVVLSGVCPLSSR